MYFYKTIDVFKLVKMDFTLIRKQTPANPVLTVVSLALENPTTTVFLAT